MQEGKLRRTEKQMPQDKTLELLKNAKEGILSLADANKGYGVPMNFALEGNSIYFHCAKEGRKLEAIKTNPYASFCVIDKVKLLPKKFSTAFESAIAEGKISVCEDETECTNALMLIAKKYSPDFLEEAQKYIEASKHKTLILRLDIEILTGKCRYE